MGGKVAAQGACRQTFRRRKTHSEIAFVPLAMVNSVLSRILRSEGTASLRYPIIKQQQATDAEVIINLARSMAVGSFHFSRSSGLCGGCGQKSGAEAPGPVPACSGDLQGRCRIITT